MTLKFNRVRAVVKVYVHAKYQAECSGSCVIVLTILVKIRKIRSSDLDRWPMTLKFSGFRVVDNEHVHAKFHRAKCSSYLAYREKNKFCRKHYSPSLRRGQ